MPPLFLHAGRHVGAEPRLTQSTVEREWESRCYEIFRTQVGPHFGRCRWWPDGS